jgi:hypothetical protein
MVLIHSASTDLRADEPSNKSSTTELIQLDARWSKVGARLSSARIRQLRRITSNS